MPMIVACKCGKKLKVRDELAGKKVKCPGCGGIVEVEEIVEEVVDLGPAPPAVPVKAVRPPAPPARVEEPAAASAAYWECRREFTGGLLVVTDEALWFNKLADKELKRAKRQLDDGDDPDDVLAENATRFCLRFNDISAITFNKKHKQIQVEYPSGDDKETTNLYFEDFETRDAAFKEIKRRVGAEWEFKRRDLNAIQAALSPLVVIGILLLVFGFFVFLAWAFNQPAEDGRPRVVRTSLWGLLIAYTVGWLGPLWTGVIGGLCLVGAVAWMIVRMSDPPIEISLKPLANKASAKKQDDDEEEEQDDEDDDDRPRRRRRREHDD